MPVQYKYKSFTRDHIFYILFARADFLIYSENFYSEHLSKVDTFQIAELLNSSVKIHVHKRDHNL